MQPMTWRRLPLLGLAVAAFVFNSSEFMPVALLTDIAASFALSETQAGLMISLYAWGVMLLSLPLMVMGSRLDYRRLMLVVLGVFLVGQAASALAPSFALLVVARLVVAAAHAVFWSIASPVAARIAGPKHASYALGLVVTGSAVAMIAGLPAGRVIGLALGWRMTFACIAGCALVLLAALAALLPRMEKNEPFSVRQLPTLAKNRALMTVYAVTVLVATGYYVGYSYIEPFMAQVGGLSEGGITLALMVFGCAGLLGGVVHARLAGKTRVAQVCLSMAGIALALLLMDGAALTVGLGALLAVCAVWGVGSTLFNVSFQAEVIGCTQASATAVAMSIFSGLFNLGIGAGSWLGGVVIDCAGIGAIGFVGGALALAGLAVYLAGAGVTRRTRRTRQARRGADRG